MRKIAILLATLFALLCVGEVEAKNDSLKMAQRAEREREKEERRRLAEIERMAQPRFKGGDIDKFEAWIVANLRFDYGLLPPGTPHVTIEVPFYVEADGKTTLSDEDTPAKHHYPRIVSEIERVILFSPDWEPGHDPFGNPLRSHQKVSIMLKNPAYTAPAFPSPRVRRPIRRR